MHDHGSPKRSGAGCVGLLMLVCRLGEGHQDGWGATDGQFTQAAGARTADGEIGMLQQTRHLMTERLFHQVGVIEFSYI